MREYITPERIANQIRLRRSNFSGVFIIVEGSSDKLIYERLVSIEKCEFSIAFNKDNAINALGILDQDNFKGVLAIVDADFSVLEGSVHNSSNLFVTDDHDLEMMLIKSPALEKVLRELGSEDKIFNFGKDVRKTLVESGKIIGYLRWASLKHNLNLKFEDLSFSKFIEQKSLSINTLTLIQVIKNHSQKPALVDKEVEKLLNALQNPNHDLWHVCCGHDLICILSIALCKTLGSCNTNDVKPEVLEREFRLAYEESYFFNTQLYTLIQNWQNNHPYQILN
jgi:Protein of unknown function (DUF4435)